MNLARIESQRIRRYIDPNGNVTVEMQDIEWDELRTFRDAWLKESDLWMLADRYSQLTDEQQTDLTIYRQALRDLPDYDTANDAADAFPTPLEWMIS